MSRTHRLILLVLLCIGVHVALLAWLEKPPPRSPAPAFFGSSIKLINDSWSAQRLANMPGMNDPAVFALPGIHGFSASAWLSFKPLQHKFSESQTPPQWLDAPVAEMGNVFKEFFATNTPASMRIADEPLPPLIGSTPRESSDLPLPSSELRVTGAIAGRPILNAPPLPSWPHTDMLTNTVIQVVVDADGSPLTCTILSTCGLKEADAHALKLARSLRFKPLRARTKNGAESLTSGKLMFMWQTIAPTSAPPTSGRPGGPTLP